MAVEIVLTRPVSQLPTLTFPGWDDFGQIANTLRQLENGMFRHAAVMADQMWRDDRFYAVMRKRLDALESVPLMVKPADTRAKAVKIAEQLGGIEDVPGKWDERFPAPILEELIEWGILMGVGIGENIWRTDDEETPVDVAPGTSYSNGKRLRWTSRIKVWNPQWLRWDWSLFRYRLMTAEGEITLPDISENPRSDGKWILWCPYGYTEAWKKGAVRSLARCITRRGWIDRDWGRNIEKNGMSIDKAIVPTEAPPEAKDAFFDAVANRNGETAVMCEQSADEAKGKFDIELVESKQPASANFDKAKGDVNKDIAIALLGQNLTTEVGDAGSKAAEQGHADVELNYLRKDAGIGTCVHLQVLTHDAQHNYNDATLAPRPVWQVDPPEDQAAKAKMLSDLGAGLSSLKASGAPIDERAVLEQASLPTVTPEEQAARDAIAREEAAANAAAANGTDGEDGAGPGRGASGAGAEGGKGTAKMAAKPIVKRVSFAGMQIAVENPKGSTRYWRADGADGAVTGSTVMQHDYGYIEGHVGNDGDEIDCYLGSNEAAENVHVIHQKLAPDFQRYDEDKVMLGFSTPDEAIAAFAAHRNDGLQAFGGMSTTPLPVFKAKLRRRTGTGRIRAGAAAVQMRSSSSATTQALVRLTARAGTALELAQKVPTPKNLKFADGLIRASALLGSRALAGDLVTVKHEIDAASGFQDLEKRLVSAFADMDPERLASAVKRTRIMANLAGRLSVLKQIGRAKKKP